MKPSPFAYHAPESVDETLATLGELGEDGKVLAGGQSLIPLLNMRLAAPPALVDLARVPELDTVEVTAGQVRVPARVTHERLRTHAEATAAIPLLRQALDWVAHPVIRNRGTALGSIVHGDPAGELPALLGLLDGHVELVSSEGPREATADTFLLGPLEADVRPGELARAVVFSRPAPRTGSAFEELARRHGDYAMAGVAVTVTLEPDRNVAAARASFIGVGGTPVAVDLGDALRGQAFDALEPGEAIALARAAIDPTDDIHATASYRRHLAGVLLGRALESAARRAAEDAAPEEGTHT